VIKGEVEIHVTVLGKELACGKVLSEAYRWPKHLSQK